MHAEMTPMPEPPEQLSGPFSANELADLSNLQVENLQQGNFKIVILSFDNI